MADMADTIYCGERIHGSTTVWKKTTQNGEEAARVELAPRLDLINHSPTGFEWGYGGSGPAQLALALLVDVTRNEKTALAAYQSFKWEVVAQLPHTAWQLTAEAIREMLGDLHHSPDLPTLIKTGPPDQADQPNQHNQSSEQG